MSYASNSADTNLHSEGVISGERCRTLRGQAQGSVPTRTMIVLAPTCIQREQFQVNVAVPYAPKGARLCPYANGAVCPSECQSVYYYLGAKCPMICCGWSSVVSLKSPSAARIGRSVTAKRSDT